MIIFKILQEFLITVWFMRFEIFFTCLLGVIPALKFVAVDPSYIDTAMFELNLFINAFSGFKRFACMLFDLPWNCIE